MNNNTIENIFIINLSRRTDLLNKIQYIFNFIKEQYPNINIQRIEGIDIKEKQQDNPLLFNNLLTNNVIALNASGLRNTKDGVLGEIGCYLSHKNCWETIISNKLNNTLILEDGVIFNKLNFSSNITINQNYFNYDIIFCNKEMNVVQSTLTGYGLQGYIVSYNGANKLVEYCNQMQLPIDLQIRNVCNEKKLLWYKLNNFFVERNNHRESSISEHEFYENNLNEKQNMDPIIIRLLKNMVKANINLVEYL
jgi:glycosyl transferase family 25